MTAITFAFILHNKVRLLVRSHFCYLCIEGRNIKKDEFMKKSRILCLSLCMVVLTACAYTQKGDEMESKITENKVYETENSMQQTETFTAESKVTDVMEDTAFQGYEQFMMLGDAELNRRFSMQDEAEQKAKIDREQANELEYADESQKAEDSDSTSGGEKPVRNPEREKPKWEDTITNRMMHWSYTAEQKEEVKKALAAGVPKATILTYFYPEVTVEKMSSYWKNQ